MANYKIRMDTYAPGLKPKRNPEDKKKLKKLISDFESRLIGLDDEMLEMGVERIVIDIIKKGGLADDGDD